MTPTEWRKTSQDLAPVSHVPVPVGQYDLYPGFSIGNNKIGLGFGGLAGELAKHMIVIIDGFQGIFWDQLRADLDAKLRNLGITASWTDVADALLPEESIDALIEPFLGGHDPIFGTRFSGELLDFFNGQKLSALQPDAAADLNILYGCGAALSGWQGTLIYVDLPKNELQFRSRAGGITNLGTTKPQAPKPMYKRFYFVDWIVLNQHKAGLLPKIDLFVDGQRPDDPTWMSGDDLRAGLESMSRNYFRVRPWFEPGAWGGQWIKEKIPQLPQDAVNYAWSFELIVPENGLLFESDGLLLEVSFDLLMYRDNRAIIGDCADFFGYEFPIRFDFLDTFDGGNLSVQCHPRPDYIRQHFGEAYTQDETYYILDAGPDARVYLGFNENIDTDEFRSELERSFNEATSIDVERFVNVEPAKKHDLFLIPNGTIHCAGVDVMVLEISATPYIFTFKMYDWMRLDLDGKPRPINIERAFENLYFDRKGSRIQEEFVSHPTTLSEGDGWRLIHMPTHPLHFYDVYRYEFTTSVAGETGASCHIMSLVEGRSVILETANGLRQRFNFAETFVVPAAAGRYTLTSEDNQPVKVVMALVKETLPESL